MADNDEQVAKNLLVYAADKGTQDVDRQKINAIILEMSGDSKYTNEKKEKRDNSQEWIQTARKKLATFDATQRSVARHHLAKAEARFEKRRHELDAAGTCCAVVDFDMFYAAVEIRDRPELKDKPVAVGGIVARCVEINCNALHAIDAMDSMAWDSLVYFLTGQR